MAHNMEPSSALGVAAGAAIFHSVLMKSKLLLLIVVGSLGFAPVRGADKKTAEATPELKIHPKVFTYIEGWLSDGESLIATEINLDAAEISVNQFNTQDIKQEDGWFRCPGRDGMGFLRHRVLTCQRVHYKIAYQENGEAH